MYDLTQSILAQETRVWEALVQGNAAADDAALASDFLGVYADGFAGKAAHVGQLADGPTVVRYCLSDVQVRSLGHDHALISYRADFTRTNHASPERMFVSSIWQKDGGRWINIFSQDTSAQ